MKICVSDYYRAKGVTAVYVALNKEPRRVATLLWEDRHMTSMSYARYLYTSHYRVDLDPKDEVDHINNNRLDDRIENLQVLNSKENRKKSAAISSMTELICPICGCTFLMYTRNVKFKKNPCCSRSCGYKKTSITLRNRHKNKLDADT